jgi:hypothetical protein
MASNNYWASGQWNFICELCGAKRKSKDGVKTWDGHYVCSSHREVRNPQDFVRGVRENLTVPWTRPPTDDQFVPIEYDRSFADEADITEELSFNLSRIIGFNTVSPDGLNGSALNSSVMNSTSYTTVNEEQLVVSESVYQGALGSFADSAAASETVSLTFTTSTSLNGSTLNTLALG